MSASRAIVTINTPSDREQIARWARNVDWGTVVEFKKKTRSTEQNAKMHAMLSEVADQVVWYGKKLKVEDWKNMFSASLRKAQVVPGIDPGTVVPLGIHTSTMTIEEMSNMIELIYAFGADPEHPVTFREPQEDMTNEQNNPPSDAAPPAPSDEGGALQPDASPSSDVPPNEPAGDSPLSAPAGSDLFGKFNFDPRELVDLKDFARKALDAAIASDSTAACLSFIETMRASYEKAIKSEEGLKAMSAMDPAFDAMMKGKRTREQAANYIATELLGCEPSELEGWK